MMKMALTGESMMKMRDLEAVLAEVRQLLRKVDAHLQPVPTLHGYKAAAARLGFGVTKLRAEVKAKRIRPTFSGGRWMVAESEIQRYSRPAPTPPGRPSRSSRPAPRKAGRAPAGPSVREEVEAFLKGRRGR